MTSKTSPEGSTRRIPSGSPPGRGMDREETYDNRRNMHRSESAQRPASRRNSERLENRGQGRSVPNRPVSAKEPGYSKGSRSGPARESGHSAGSRAAQGRRAQSDRHSGKPRESRPGGSERSGRSRNQNKNARDKSMGNAPGSKTKAGDTGEKRNVRQPAESGRQGKQTRRPKPRWKFMLGILLGIAFITGVGFLAVQLFETKKITVTGNQYVSEQEVIDWLLADEHSGNSLYLLWKYNQNNVQQLPAIEETKVGLKNLVEVQVQVKEKDFSGRIDYNEAFLYFDQEGIASLITGTEIEGVPYIEGMEINPEEVLLGSVLPVTDGQIFEELKNLMPLLEKQDLSPDKISCAGADLTLHFGGVRVQIGSSQFADRLAQVPPILEKLAELYADQTGVLHLENYDVSGSSIRFVPDTAAQPQPETQ